MSAPARQTSCCPDSGASRWRGIAGSAGAEDGETPSAAEVEAAQAAAAESAGSVAEVQARLAVANQRLWDTSIAAEQATEAYNGARWRLQGAKKEARQAERAAQAASDDAARQQQAYSDAVVSSYQTAPELTALNSIMQSDGIASMIERSSTMMVAESAMSTRYDELRAANKLAQTAAAKSEKARAKAADRRSRDPQGPRRSACGRAECGECCRGHHRRARGPHCAMGGTQGHQRRAGRGARGSTGGAARAARSQPTVEESPRRRSTEHAGNGSRTRQTHRLRRSITGAGRAITEPREDAYPNSRTRRSAGHDPGRSATRIRWGWASDRLRPGTDR